MTLSRPPSIIGKQRRNHWMQNLSQKRTLTPSSLQPPKTSEFPRWTEIAPYDQCPMGVGTTAAGIRYEMKVGKVLQEIAAACGWEFRDHPWIETAAGFLQPDYVLIPPSNKGILVECKLTWLNCHSQIMRYKIALNLLGVPCISVLACKNLTPETPPHRLRHFEDITDGAIWHLHL